MPDRKAEENLYIQPQENLGAVIRVIGVGGGGCNAINRMMEDHPGGIDFIAINTDHQDLERSTAHFTLQIGEKVTRGLGAGADPEKGEMAANESRDEISQLIRGTDLLFITAGMGGGTGTGAAPVVAEIARDMGVLSVGVVTRPFSFEGAARRRNADMGIQKLEGLVDALIIVQNDKLLDIADQDMDMDDAYKFADRALQQGVAGIADLVSRPGQMNLDMSDVRRVISGAGICHMGVGSASGADRASVAVNQAIHSPLLDTTIDGASRILIQYLGKNIKMQEINLASTLIRDAAGKDAEIITGYGSDPGATGDELVITVIAAGFENQGRAPERSFNSSFDGLGGFTNPGQRSNPQQTPSNYPSFLQSGANRPGSTPVQQTGRTPSLATPPTRQTARQPLQSQRPTGRQPVQAQQEYPAPASNPAPSRSVYTQLTQDPIPGAQPVKPNVGEAPWGQTEEAKRSANRKRGGLGSWLFSEQDDSFEE